MKRTSLLEKRLTEPTLLEMSGLPTYQDFGSRNRQMVLNVYYTIRRGPAVESFRQVATCVPIFAVGDLALFFATEIDNRLQ